MPPLNERDENLILDAAAEVGRKADPMTVVMQPATVIQFTGLLQLALRHPAVNDVHAAVARRFIDAASEFFSDSPGVLDLIARGFDPAEDR